MTRKDLLDRKRKLNEDIKTIQTQINNIDNELVGWDNSLRFDYEV